MNNKHQTPTEKTLSGTEIPPAELALVNKFTRRKLKADEVFLFPVILCDNEIDRDYERFPQKSLEALAPMFTGKTGVFDHSAQAKNQSARIYRTQVATDDSRSVHGGESYACLKAWAYMVRSQSNSDLILEIDAGIKKEVSVGCAVAKAMCSVCGADQKQSACNHRKAESYGGVICYHELCEPTDAYEWSFVAVPAQKNAGVTKAYPAQTSADVLDRIQKNTGPLELSHADIKSLRGYLAGLKELCKAGEEYTAELKRDVVRLAAITNPALDRTVLEEVSHKMSTTQLKAFAEGFKAAASKAIPTPQLAPMTEDTRTNDNQFRI